MTKREIPDDQLMSALGRSPHHRWMVSPSRVSLVRPLVPPRPVDIAAQAKDVQFDAARTALVTVDMQNDFMHDDGWFALRGANRAPLYRPVEPLRRLIPVLRRHGIPIIWLGWGARPDGLDVPPNVLHSGTYCGDGINLCDPHPTRGYNILEVGSWGCKVIDELPAEPGDIYVYKTRLSGFYDTDFDTVLRNQGITTLLFAGVNLDRCVITTLQDASYLGYDCILIEDCSSTVHPEFATQSCHLMIKQLLGFITTSDALIKGLDG
ncbi:MAG: cysteine hydrolase family protein [Betaproteobacteria bacterium]